MRHRSVFVCLALALCAPAAAQDRLELQAVTVSARYQFIENGSNDVTASKLQFKDTVRMRLRLVQDGRFFVAGALMSGGTFTGSWDNTGIGTGDLAGTQSLRQLFVSAAPVRGFELQAGGLYMLHGENSEITSYDDDGYLMGARIVVRAPAKAFFDEASVTRAALGPTTTPGVLRRLDTLAGPNYWQAHVVKHVGRRIQTSGDFTSVHGAPTLRAAIAFRLGECAPVSAIRFEQYRRMTVRPASGFAVSAERMVPHRVRVQAGYADIDLAYGELNGDRFQQGRRVFATATIPIAGPLTAQLFATQAFASSYAVTNRTRFDAVLSYDLLAAVRRHHQM